MPQLNILPINVSQSVDTKDDSAAPASTSSKDEFSQHIDLHLAKNKDSSQHKKNVADEKVDANTVKASPKQASTKADNKTQQSSDEPITSTSEVESANNAQEVAASGKNGVKEPEKEHLAEEKLPTDESELLMSFLIKADKTLTKESSAENITLSEMSAEQKAKYEAQLLLKSSDLVAGLSGVAKALAPNSENSLEQLSEQEQAAKALLATAKNSKIDSNAKPLIEGENVEAKNLEAENIPKEGTDKLNLNKDGKAVSGDVSLIDKGALNPQLISTKQAGEKVIDGTNGKAIETAHDLSAQQLAKNELKGNVSNIAEEAGKEEAQKEFIKPVIVSDKKNLESSDIKLTAKPAASEQAVTSIPNSLEEEAKISNKIAELLQSKNGIENKEGSLASAISASQHDSRNKDLSRANLSQVSVETKGEEVVLDDSEAQLSAKSVEHLIEQSKEFTTNENKEGSNKALPKTSTDFAVNSNFVDATSRATRVTQEVVDQQVTEVFNPTGSSEVSQSQKTNTQLHQETIAIFRRDFADAVKDKVMLMISQKLQQFDISLDPPELGNMQVRVNLQGEQATVNFVVQNQQAKDAFEQNMHKLRELLAEQGVDVGDANVEQQSQQSGNEETPDDNAINSTINTADANDVIEHNLSARMINSSTTAVDYYA